METATKDAAQEASDLTLDGAKLDLANLDGSDGFLITGASAGDALGGSVKAAGDVNGDGIADIILGASGASPDGRAGAGESYVIFGSNTGFSASVAVSQLDGSDGFVLKGIDPDDGSGIDVSAAGDFNNDGFDDFIIGANRADPNGALSAGESYLVFGQQGGFGGTLDLAGLDGSDGLRIEGEASPDELGFAVSNAGDVNGDGFDDIIVGAVDAEVGAKADAGKAYVIFGTDANLGPALDPGSLDGSDGFVLKGAAASDFAGYSVKAAGDVNGDGFDDILIGANYADPGGKDAAGKSYLVFGKAGGFAAGLNLASLDGSDGFTIPGKSAFDYSGTAVAAAGDVNGDGIDDFIVSAPYAGGGADNAGEAYVIFGKTGGFGTKFNPANLDGRNGFTIEGAAADDNLGRWVSNAGDFNGDGFDDVIIGANGAGTGGEDAGAAYLIFGKPGGFDATLNVADLDGADGIVLEGLDGTDLTGSSVSTAGDLNNDGIDDIIIGAPGADAEAGEAYVVFGDASLGPALTLLGGAGNDKLIGGAKDDTLKGRGGDDILRGLAGDDTLMGGTGGDVLRGGADSDSLSGNGGADVLIGALGDDDLFGGGGADSLSGGNNADDLSGGAGADSLTGGKGQDRLTGGKGNDQLSGEAGADSFIFAPGDGNDTVLDFISLEDLLDVSAFGFADGAAVLAVTADQNGSAVISLSAGTSITLDGVLTASLDQADFIV